MKIKYYLDKWDYWVDFHTKTPRENSITKEVSEEELHELIQCTMCEIEERVRGVLREL